MKAIVVSGSHRSQSQSNRIGRLIGENFLGVFSEVGYQFVSEIDLPFWSEGAWNANEDPAWNSILPKFQSEVDSADAFVVVTPEWSGMVPPMLKNYFLLCDQSIMRHKPALIVSISSGRGGSYPVNELRTSSYKNTKLLYIPEHIIIRNCEEFMNGSDSDDNYLINRIKFSTSLLAKYAEAMKVVRQANIEFDEYQYGM